MNNFYKNIYKNIDDTKNQFIELRAFQSNERTKREFITLKNFEEGIERFMYEYNDTYNCYYGIATRSNNKSGKKEDCEFLPAIFVDIDCDSKTRKGDSLFSNKEDALNHLKRLNLGETAIVDSGNGLHVYWFFEEPIRVSKYTEMLEELMKHLSTIVGGDSTHDISRIFRIPDSLNLKDPANPKSCEVIHADYSRRYGLETLSDKITSHKLYKTPLNKIKSKEIYKYLFGLYDESKYKSRSEADQKIITSLIGYGFSEWEIYAIFHYMPTTGKYFDKMAVSEENAAKYLEHSFVNALAFVRDDNRIIEEYDYDLEKPSPIADQIHSDDSIVEYENKNLYSKENQIEKLGYYKLVEVSNGFVAEKITNFVIDFEEQIKKKIDGKTSSIFKGKIRFDDGSSFKFDDFKADFLADRSEFIKYLSNNFGMKPKFYKYKSYILDALKYQTFDPVLIESKEYGLSDTKDKYFTSDLIITKSDFIKEKTPILHDNIGANNYLGFEGVENPKSLSEVKQMIKDNLLNWDKPEVTLYSLAFAILPIIFPFIQKYCNGRPYILLHGPSGCGKTTMVLLMQHFYGNIKNLTSWSSTPNSIEIKGHSFKDALYCVDDMKFQNIPQRDRGKVQLLMQNYGDETGRNRANVKLELREQRYIRGILMVSAEDLVLTETSAIARGIIVPVDVKESDHDGRNQLIEDSEYYPIFTKHFIQEILQLAENYDFGELFRTKQREAERLLSELNLVSDSTDNTPRMVNNFAVAAVAFEFLKMFLFADFGQSELKKREKQFTEATKKLMAKNFRKIHFHKPEEKFESTLWELIEMNLLHLENINSIDSSYFKKENIVGYYWFREDGTVKVSININTAYRRIDQYLQHEGGLGHSKDTVVGKLSSIGKIKIPSRNGYQNARVSFGGGKTQRGVEWIGEVPFEDLGIRTTVEYRHRNSDDELPF